MRHCFASGIVALGIGDLGRVPYLADRCLGRLGEWLENIVLIQQLSVPLRLRSERLRAGDDEEPSLSTRGRIEVGGRRDDQRRDDDDGKNEQLAHGMTPGWSARLECA